MLTKDDEQLCCADLSLTGLRQVLDSAWVNREIASAWPKIGHFEFIPVYLRYKPQESCLVQYQAIIDGEQVNISAKTYSHRNNDKIRKFSAIAESEEYGTKVHCVAPGHLFLIAPGYDRKLKRLAQLPTYLAPQVQTKSADNIHLHTLKYKAERRWVGRVDLKGSVVGVAKTYTETIYDKAHDAARFFSRRKKIPSAKLIFTSSKAKTLVFEWIEGDLLVDAVQTADTDKLKNFSDKIIHLLTTIHKAKPKAKWQPVQTVSMNDWQDHTSYLADIAGGEISPYQNMMDCICQWLAVLPPTNTIVHGDFSLDQLIDSSGSLKVIDFDRAGYGYPMQDIAQLLAKIKLQEVQGKMKAGVFNAVKSELIETMKRLCQYYDEDQLEIFYAAALVRLSVEPFRQRATDWRKALVSILSLANQVFEAAKHQITANTTQWNLNKIVVNDESMPWLAEMLSKRWSQEIVAPLLFEKTGKQHKVVTAKAIKYRPNRRCLIEYELLTEYSNNTHIIGKIRAKGFDKKTWELNRQLREQGFNESSDDGFSVPEVLGKKENYNVWFQRKISGDNLCYLVKNCAPGLYGARIASLANKLHFSKTKLARQHTIQDEWRILQERIRLVYEQKPQWENRLEKLLETARKRVESHKPSRKTVVAHRDYYPDQIIVDSNDRWYLLDLDLCCMAEPALDIGNFVAHLIEQAMREQKSPNAYKKLEDAIICTSVNLNQNCTQDAIRLYSDLTLLRHIQISQRIDKRNWLTSNLIELCESRLGI